MDGSAKGGSITPTWHPRHSKSLPAPQWGWEALSGDRTLDFEVCLEVRGLQAILDGGDEAACVRTVNHLVIVGEWQVAHLADGDGVLAIFRHHNGTLGDGSGAEDAGLRRNQNRGIQQGALGADVGHREGGTGEVVRLELVVAGLVSQLGDLLRDLREGCLLYTSPSPRDS